MKKILTFSLLIIVAILTFIPKQAEAKIWTKDLVDKVTLDSGYKFSLCTIDMKYDRRDSADNILSVQEKDFENNPDSYPCNKYSQEDILFANITLNFSKTNWSGGSAHEKIIEFQNKLYSVDNYGSLFNSDFADSKGVYADLAGTDWFSTTPGLRGIRGRNFVSTDPSAKGESLPNSSFIVIHDPSTGKYTSALFVINGLTYKLSNMISQVTTETTLVDYTQPITTISPSVSAIQPSINVTYPIGGESLQKGSDTGINLKFSPSVPLGGFVVNLINVGTGDVVAHLKYCGLGNVVSDSVVPPNVTWQWKVGFGADGKEIPDGSYRILAYSCGSKVDNVWMTTIISPESNVFNIVSSASTQSSITVLSPTDQQPGGAEDWMIGKTYDVIWSYSGPSDCTVSVNLVNSETNMAYGGNNLPILASLGKYSFTVSSNIPPAGKDVYRIEAVGGKGCPMGKSSGYFDVFSPTPILTSGEIKIINSPIIEVPLTWTKVEIAGKYNVYVKHSKDGNYGAALAGTGSLSYSAQVSAAEDNYFMVQACSDASTCYSSNEVYISKEIGVPANPSITVVSPNGGEIWQVGNTYDVTWNYSGPNNCSVSVGVYDTSNNMAGYGGNSMPILASLRKYSFTVSSNIPVGDTYKISVVGDKGCGFGQSNGHFKIVK